MPSYIIMLAPKLKWPREASFLPDSIQPISDQRTRLALQVAERPMDDHRTRSTHVIHTGKSLTYFSFRTKTLLFFCIQLFRVWSVLDILTWNKRELEENILSSGYTTAPDILFTGIYKIQLLR